MVMRCDEVPGVKPFNPDLLKGLTNEELLLAAEYFMRAKYEAKRWLASPLAGPDDRDDEAVAAAGSRLAAVAEVLGGRLLAGLIPDLPPDRRQEVVSVAGNLLIEEYHGELMDSLAIELDLWKAGAWDELRTRGRITPADYAGCMRNWPGENPNFPGYWRLLEWKYPLPWAGGRFRGDCDPADAGRLRGMAPAELLSLASNAPADEVAGIGSILGEKLLHGWLPAAIGDRRREVEWMVGPGVAQALRRVSRSN